jgi:hypothetical protein
LQGRKQKATHTRINIKAIRKLYLFIDQASKQKEKAIRRVNLYPMEIKKKEHNDNLINMIRKLANNILFLVPLSFDFAFYSEE